jgi:hypothetical protein
MQYISLLTPITITMMGDQYQYVMFVVLSGVRFTKIWVAHTYDVVSHRKQAKLVGELNERLPPVRLRITGEYPRGYNYRCRSDRLH